MRVSAKADYALRALAELAVAAPGPVKGERIATAQDIPLKFLENILLELRHAELVASQRGAEGGYWLAGAAGGDQPRRRHPRRRGADRERARARAPRTSSTPVPAEGAASERAGSRCARTCAPCSRAMTLADVRRGQAPGRAKSTAIGRGCAARLGEASRTTRSSERCARRDVHDLPRLELELLAGRASPAPRAARRRRGRARRAPRSRGGRSARPSPRRRRSRVESDLDVVRAHERVAEAVDRADEAHHELVRRDARRGRAACRSARCGRGSSPRSGRRPPSPPPGRA